MSASVRHRGEYDAPTWRTPLLNEMQARKVSAEQEIRSRVLECRRPNAAEWILNSASRFHTDRSHAFRSHNDHMRADRSGKHYFGFWFGYSDIGCPVAAQRNAVCNCCARLR